MRYVDSLRGFAVLAILLVHHVEHFIYPVYPDPATLPGWLNVLNEGVFTVVFGLFAGKSYSIFALLFGFTFYIQYSNQQAKGKDFGYRFLWRMLLLTLFATLNAAFYLAGDVLLLYAIVGVVLFIVRKWSDKAVLITAIIFLLQPVEWYHYIASLFNPGHQLPDLGVGAMYAEMAEHTKRGDLWNFIWQNVTLGQKASLFWAVGAGRYVQTCGLFMLGMLIGRKKLFIPSEENSRFWIKTLIIASIAFCSLFQLGVFFFGALIYFPISLNLAPYCGYTVSMFIGIAFFFLQVRFCKWWAERHKHGPLEGIWHKWTWVGSK